MTQTPETGLVAAAQSRGFTSRVELPATLGPTAAGIVEVVAWADIEAVIILLKDAAELHTLDDDSFEMAEHVNSELVKRRKNIVATADVPIRALREAGTSARAARDEATGQIDDAIAVLSQSLLDYTDRKKAEADAARVAAENRQRQIDEQNAKQAEVRDAQQERDDERAEHAARLEIANGLVRDAFDAGVCGVTMPPEEHWPIVKSLLRAEMLWLGDGILRHSSHGKDTAAYRERDAWYLAPEGFDGVEPADLSPLPDAPIRGESDTTVVEIDGKKTWAIDGVVTTGDASEGTVTNTQPVSVHVPKSRVHARKNRSLEIDNPEQIPYRATEGGEALMVPNRAACTRALRAGLSVPGCRLVEKRTAVTR